MLAAGRVKVTVTSTKTGEHITILFKAFADNRDGQFKQGGKRWMPCVYDEATHVFVEVPGASGEWADKVGTFYPNSGRWYSDANADPAREWAAAAAANWLCGAENEKATFQEQSECARCGLELTDPVSIARGIGPICLGKMTGSQHQVKVKEATEHFPGPPEEDSPDTDYSQMSLEDQADALARATGSTSVTVTKERRNEDGSLEVLGQATSESAALTQAKEMVMSLDHADIQRLIEYAEAVIQQDADDRPHLIESRDQSFLGR